MSDNQSIITMKAAYCAPANENLVPVCSCHSVFKMVHKINKCKSVV